jgi:hypothetical protein
MVCGGEAFFQHAGGDAGGDGRRNAILFDLGRLVIVQRDSQRRDAVDDRFKGGGHGAAVGDVLAHVGAAV